MTNNTTKLNIFSVVVDEALYADQLTLREAKALVARLEANGFDGAYWTA